MKHGLNWLIEGDALEQLSILLDAENRAPVDHPSRAPLAAADGPRNLSVAGSTAEIEVSGPLLPQDSRFLRFLGFAHTSYASIIQSLAAADADPAVDNIVLAIDSPGGAVDGMFEAIEAIRATRKPTSTRARTATSAAYGLAAATGRIAATGPASRFGSVGVVVEAQIRRDTVAISSTQAPDKRPDVTTPEGQAVVRKHLDDIHALFVEGIAAGRGTTAEKVNEDYGRGAVLLAAEAAERGMIDSFPQPSGARAETRAVGAQEPTENRMDADELRKKYPQAAARLIELERRRCTDHLKVGAAAGVPEKAHEAIEKGLSLDEMQGTYMAAHMSRRAIGDAQEDSDGVAGVAGGSSTLPEQDQEEAVHELVIDQLKGGTHG